MRRYEQPGNRVQCRILFAGFLGLLLSGQAASQNQDPIPRQTDDLSGRLLSDSGWTPTGAAETGVTETRVTETRVTETGAAETGAAEVVADTRAGIRPDPGADPASIRPISAEEGSEEADSGRTPVGPGSAVGPGSPVGPGSAAVSLEELEALALQHNPTLDQARAETWKAHGQYLQAGLYPNPRLGYSATEMGQDGQAGQQGALLQQEFVFGGKLALSQNIAAASRNAAEQVLTMQEWRVLNNVRQEYYAILAARRNRELAAQLLELSGSALKLATLRRQQGEGTRIDELQARGEKQRASVSLAQADNVLDAAWQRMLAVIGDPSLERRAIAGNIEAVPVPDITFDDLLRRIETTSPQLQLAEATAGQARAAYQRAEVEPVPNVTLQNVVQYDDATEFTVVSLQATLPLPIYDRNQGNIVAAENDWIRASRETERVKLSLRRQLAERWAGFANARVQVERYQNEIIPTVSETMQLTRQAFELGETNYLQLLVAQRSYMETYREYVSALGTAWQESIRLNGLLLTDGLTAPESVTESR